jgi:hypothetical protein
LLSAFREVRRHPATGQLPGIAAKHRLWKSKTDASFPGT